MASPSVFFLPPQERYRVNTEEWTVYDRKKPSYWAFEKGVYLEQFDSILSGCWIRINLSE